MQNFSLVQWALGYFGAQRRWKLRIASHTQTRIKQGLSTDLSASGCPSSVNFIPKSVLFSPESAKMCCSVEQEDRSACRYYFPVKMASQSEVWDCLYLNLLKPSQNKEGVYLQWNLKSERKKINSVSTLLLSGLLRNWINLWWIVQFISALPREFLARAVAVAQFPESSAA